MRTPQEVVDSYNGLSLRGQAEFRRIIKGQESFARGLKKLDRAIDEYGEDAVRLALLGRVAEAREAGRAYQAAKGGKQ